MERLYMRSNTGRDGYAGRWHATREGEDRALCGTGTTVRIVTQERAPKRFAAWGPNACRKCSTIAERDHSIIRDCDACGTSLVLPFDWPADWQLCRECRWAAVGAVADETGAKRPEGRIDGCTPRRVA